MFMLMNYILTEECHKLNIYLFILSFGCIINRIA